MYFNSTLTDSSKLLKPLLVFTYTISAIICGLTRIIQYKNHAIDVYSGFLLGSAVALYLVAFQTFTVVLQCSSIGIPPWCRPCGVHIEHRSHSDREAGGQGGGHKQILK